MRGRRRAGGTVALRWRRSTLAAILAGYHVPRERASHRASASPVSEVDTRVMPGRPYILAESSWTLVRQTMYDVAVLPWGATEAHNLHLPYATDTIQSEQIAAGAAQYAWGQGARVIVLPAVPFGVNTTQLDIRLTINMMPSTQLALLRDVASSLAGQGIQKLVLLNGHGGNDFRPLIRELHGNVDLFICAVDWYRCARPERIFDEPGDHAGELETSVMMHVAPELVLPLSDAGTGAARAFRISALREGWAWAPREWTRVTRDTGVGNPAHASADKGRRYAEAVTRQIGDFLVELAACDVADLYEPAPGPQAG